MNELARVLTKAVSEEWFIMPVAGASNSPRKDLQVLVTGWLSP